MLQERFLWGKFDCKRADTPLVPEFLLLSQDVVEMVLHTQRELGQQIPFMSVLRELQLTTMDDQLRIEDASNPVSLNARVTLALHRRGNLSAATPKSQWPQPICNAFTMFTGVRDPEELIMFDMSNQYNVTDWTRFRDNIIRMGPPCDAADRFGTRVWVIRHTINTRLIITILRFCPSRPGNIGFDASKLKSSCSASDPILTPPTPPPPPQATSDTAAAAAVAATASILGVNRTEEPRMRAQQETWAAYFSSGAEEVRQLDSIGRNMMVGRFVEELDDDMRKYLLGKCSLTVSCMWRTISDTIIPQWWRLVDEGRAARCHRPEV